MTVKYEEIKGIKNKKCPFCSASEEEIVDENATCCVMLARAPYTQDHLLFIPKRHVVMMEELTEEEYDDMQALLKKWMKKIHQFHQEATLVMRDGEVNGEIGKSVSHLHYHIIPNIPIGMDPQKEKERVFYEREKMLAILSTFRVKYGD